MKTIKKLIAGIMILPVLSGTTISGVYADDLSDVVGYVSQVQATDPLLPNVTNQKGVIGSLIGTVFGVDGKIKTTFLAVLGTMSSNDVPRWNGTQLVSGVIEDNGTNVGIGQSPTSNKLDVLGNIRASSKLLASEICDENGLNCGDLSAITFGSMWFQNGSDAYYNTGNVGIGTNIPGESLSVVGRISITQDPNTGDDLGDRDYNDTRYLNVGESGDSIADGTIDSSEIQANSLDSGDIATDAIGWLELADNAVGSANVINDTITEDDISDSFVARDSSLLDGVDSDNILTQKTDIGGSVDLDSMITTGLYHQNTDANASSGTNYPEDRAGMLEVIADGSMVYQKYSTYDSNGEVYVRTKYGSTWYSWKEILTKGMSGDDIANGTIDSSEIQNNSLTASDLAASSVGTSEILNNTITEDDISDSFIARDSSLLDGRDSVTTLGTNDTTIPTSKAVKDYVDVQVGGGGVSSVTMQTSEVNIWMCGSTYQWWHLRTCVNGVCSARTPAKRDPRIGNDCGGGF